MMITKNLLILIINILKIIHYANIGVFSQRIREFGNIYIVKNAECFGIKIGIYLKMTFNFMLNFL